MSKALIIGAGGVAGVVIHKCCQNSEVFTEICIASRTKSKCDKFKEELQDKTSTKISTAQVDANNVDELVALINKEKPDIVINVALPYQDLTIMDACLATKTDYLDTANYEPEDTAKFEYKWQWDYKERFEKAGITETPQTLEDLLDVCKKLKDAGMTPISAGNYDMIMRYPAFKAFRLEGNDFIDNARMGKEKFNSDTKNLSCFTREAFC